MEERASDGTVRLDAEMTKVLDQLKHAVQRLAQPAEVQLRQYPDLVCKPDELALDLDEAVQRASGMLPQLTERQRKSLHELDHRLEELSGQSNADFWTEDALIHDHRWGEIRVLAAEVLVVFDWPNEIPPRNQATYVKGGNGR